MNGVTIVFTHGGGRLANQLFNHAHLLAFCIEHAPRFSLFNAAILPYRRHLPPEIQRYGDPAPVVSAAASTLLHPAINRMLRVRLKLIQLLSPATVSTLDGVIASADRSNVVFLSGWDFAPDDSLLVKHREEVLKRMTLSYDATKVCSIVERAREHSDIIVGVHIRHGDYATLSDGAFMFSAEEYAQAMNIVADRHASSRVHFVICSDAPQQKAKFGDLDVTVSDCSSPSDDLALLSKCDFVMGTRSTFTMWAAFARNIDRLCLGRDAAGAVSVKQLQAIG